MLRRILFVCLIALAAVPVFAQPPSQGSGVTTETSTIVAIDATNRLISLKGADGVVDIVYAPPEMQRFDALKVGDKVTFKYYESVVFAIQKPGATPPADVPPTLVRTPGAKPGGTLSRQVTATVAILAIDMKVPSVTIKNDAGEVLSFKVDDKKNLQNLKAGDNVQVTYTRALAVSVEAPKK